MLTGAGLTMKKVTDVQLALHQICADEVDPRSMTAHIMAEHDVTRDDVMLVCDVAYLAIEDARTRNLRSMSPTYSLSDEDGIEPPTTDLVAEQEFVPRSLGEDVEPQHKAQDNDSSAWADAVSANFAAFGKAPGDVAAAETARLKALAAENKAKVLGASNGTA